MREPARRRWPHCRRCGRPLSTHWARKHATRVCNRCRAPEFKGGSGAGWADPLLRERDRAMTATERLLAALEARSAHAPRKTGAGRWQARCPAHDDRNPSLSITAKGNGDVLIHCHAGCDVEDVVAAVGLTLADLFEERSDGRQVVATYAYADETGGCCSRPSATSPRTSASADRTARRLGLEAPASAGALPAARVIEAVKAGRRSRSPRARRTQRSNRQANGDLQPDGRRQVA